MNNWIILSVLGGLSSSVFNYSFRHVMKSDNDSSACSWWFETLRFLFALLILPFNFYTDLSFLTILLLLSLGLVEFLSIYFYSMMHKESQLSISTIVLRLRVVWVPILAFLFVGEKLSTLNYLGVLIVFIGLSFVSSPKKFIYDKAIYVSLLCSIITAILTILTKSVSSHASPTVVILAMSFPSIFLFPLFIKNWKQRTKSFYSKSKISILIISSTSLIATYLQVSALSAGAVSQVMGIYQGMSFVAVIAGIFLLGEKDNVWQKIIGSIVVIVGAYLLI